MRIRWGVALVAAGLALAAFTVMSGLILILEGALQ